MSTVSTSCDRLRSWRRRQRSRGELSLPLGRLPRARAGRHRARPPPRARPAAPRRQRDNVLLTSSGDAMLADSWRRMPRRAHRAGGRARARGGGGALAEPPNARLPRARALRRDVRRGGRRWGVGLLVWELLAGRQPYRGRSSDEQPSAPPRRAPELHGDSVGRDLDVSADAVALVQALLSRDVTARRRAGRGDAARAPLFAEHAHGAAAARRRARRRRRRVAGAPRSGLRARRRSTALRSLSTSFAHSGEHGAALGSARRSSCAFEVRVDQPQRAARARRRRRRIGLVRGLMLEDSLSIAPMEL